MGDVTMENDTPRLIRRSDKGLTISGTRITLYDVMDYLRAGHSRDEIGDWLSLTEAELSAALEYIEAHRNEVEAEYREVVAQAEERRRYYDKLLQERLATRPPTPTTPEREKIRARLAAERARLEAQLVSEDADHRSAGQSLDSALS